MATDTTNIQSETVNSTVAHEGDVERANLTQGATQVQVPQGENVVRIQVTPGETIQLPFPTDGMIARLDDGNGNLAVKVGDVTVILQGYIAATGEADVTLVDANGQTVDVAAVVAATDPNLDIQTAAGPGAGDQGTGPDNNGGLFAPFDPAAGIGGLNGIGGLDPTLLQYGLIEREPIRVLEDEEDLDTTPIVVNITQAPPVNEDDLKDTQHARDLIDRLNEQGEDDPIEELPSFQSLSQEGGEPKWVLGKPYEDGNDPFDTEDHEEGSQTDFDGDGKSEFEPIISDDGPFDDVDRDREPLSVTAVVEANFFADLPGKMVFDANGDGINDGAGDVPLIDALVAKGLTSHGHELTYALLPAIPESAPGANDGTGQMVVAYYTVMNKYGCAENVVVFTIGINDDVVNAGETNLAGNAEFGVTFNLYGVIDHPEKNGSIEEGNGIEDILGIEVPFFLQDSDSPPVPSTWPEPLKFDVIDDVPFLGEVCYVTLCGFDVPISITKANLTIGHDESQGDQSTWYDSKLQPNGPDWLPDQQTDDVGGMPAWYLINKADDQLDDIAGGEGSGEDVDLSYQQGILSLLSEDYLNNGNFCADALGVAKTYLEVSFGADGKAKGNDQAGDTLFRHDNDTPTDVDGNYEDDAGISDGSRPNYDSAGNPIDPKDGTDKRAFELFMKNTSEGTEGAGELADKSATNWTISVEQPDGSIKILTVYAFQLDANTIIGMASPTDFEGGEEYPEDARLQGAVNNDYGGIDGEGDGVPVFMLRLDPETGQLVFVQYHQINNPEGGNAAHPDWDGSANDPIHLLDANGNPLVFFQATDYDGDTVTSALEVSVIDDAPEICDIDYNNQGTEKGDRGYLDEDFLTAATNGVPGNKDYDTSPDNINSSNANSGNNGDGPGGTKVTGKIIADFGVDTPGKFTFNVAGLAVGGDAVDTSLKTAEGNTVQYKLVEVAGGFELQALDKSDGSTVFTVFLNKDTGNFCFELLEALGHPDSDGNSKNNSKDDGTARYEDDILIQLGVRATDVDGDYKNATLEFKVDDDAPKLVCPPETVSIQNGECPVCQTTETQGTNLVASPENDCLSEETCMVTIKPGEDYAHWLKLTVAIQDEEGLDEPNKNDDELFAQQGVGFGVISGEDGGSGGRYDEINYDHTANGGQGASETLIFKIGTEACPQTALSATVQLSRFYSDEGNVGNERGKWQAFKDGVLVGEGEFEADSTTGQFGLAIPTIPGGFNELRFTALAGSLNPQGNSDDSDYYVQALNLEIQPVHMLTGKFAYTFGADNGDPATDVTIAYKGAALTSGGKAVVLVSETDPETGITTIRGYKDVDGNGADEGDLPVFKLVVDPSASVDANGVHQASYTFTQYGPLDNNPGGSDLPFEVKIVDNDGDAITTCIDICIDDSAPETDTTCATVYEKALDQSGSAKDGTDENANGEFAHGFLNFSYNGDGPGSITEFKQTSGVGGTTSATLVNGLWTITTAYYKITVDEITGEYSFQLTKNLDHDDTADDGFNNREGVEGTVNVQDILKELGFEYTVKDADGSTATGGLTVKVVDDGPILCVDLDSRGAVEIDESSNNQRDDRNNGDAPAALAAIGSIIEYANDGDSIVDIDVEFGADGAKAGGGLTLAVKASSEGVDSGINFKDANGNIQNVVLTTEGNVVVGRVESGPDAGKAVFAVMVDGNGELHVAQYLPIYHSNPNNHDDSTDLINSALQLVVSATDSDGDTVSEVKSIGDYVTFYDDGPSISVSGYTNQSPEGSGGSKTHGNDYGYVDEDFLSPNGNNDKGSESDDSVGGVKSIANLNVNAGTDGLQSLTIHHSQVDVHGDDGSGLRRTSDGAPVVMSTSPDGQTIFGYANGVVDPANLVFTIKIVGNTVEFELFQALMQDSTGGGYNSGDGNVEGEVKFDIPVTITDRDGDRDTTEVHFLVDDDQVDAVDDGVLTITDLNVAQSGANLLANDLLGADRPTTVTQVKLGNTWYNVDQDADGTTFKINSDGSKDGDDDYVGKLTIDKNGNWSFEQTEGSDAKDITFEYRIVDADKDTDTAKFKVDLLEQDDIPTLTVDHGPQNTAGFGYVDEDELSPDGLKDNASGDNAGGTTFTGGYNADFLQDFNGSVSFATADETDTGIDTLDGTNILWNRVSDTELVGYKEGTDASDPANQYFKVTLSGPNPSATGDGTWTFELLKPVKHSVNGTEDDLNVTVNLVAHDKDGDASNLAAINIKIDDDLPVTTDNSIQANAGSGGTADVVFIVDVSGSMTDDNAFVDNVPSPFAENRLGLARYSMYEMLEAHPEIQNVLITKFDDSASSSVWMSRADAMAYILVDGNFNGGGYTNYDDALQSMMDAYDNSARPETQGDQTLVYFMSDGEPNRPESDPGITGEGSGSNVSETEWTNFVNDPANEITNVFAIGLGSGVNAGNLAPISYPNTDTGPAGEDNVIVIPDFNDVGELLATIDAFLAGVLTPVEGNILTDVLVDKSGADGWGTPSLVSITYDKDGAGGADPVVTAFGPGDTKHTIDLGDGRGSITVYADGKYEYMPPSGSNVDPDPFYLEYTVQDGDGDQATGKLTIDINAAPMITSDDAFAINENTAAVTTVTAVDPDGDAPNVFSITGGADKDLFQIDPNTGQLSFISAPDYENPQDAGKDNVYDVEVTVTTGGLTDTQHIAVTVNNVNEFAPVITSDGGGASANKSVAENTKNVTTVVATDGDKNTTITYSITGGADAAFFQINAVTGLLSFINAPDFEDAKDNGKNNVYDVQVTASDGSLTDVQNIAVTVTNVAENQAPVGKADHIYTNTNQEVTVQAAWLLANDSDADGNPLSVTDVDENTSEFGFEDLGNLPNNFTLDIDGGSMENGEAGDYTYDLSDGTVEVTVAGGQVHYDTSGALEGGATDDIMIGGSGDDTIDGKGGADFLIGNGGDDTLVFDAADKLVDGGADFDRAQSTANFAFDNVAAGGAKFVNVEMLSLGDSDDGQENTVTINAADVLDQNIVTVDTDPGAGGGNVNNVQIDLFIVGDHEGGTRDNVQLTGFTQVLDLDNAAGNQSTFQYNDGTFGNHTYTLWTNGSKLIAVESGLDVTTV